MSGWYRGEGKYATRKGSWTRKGNPTITRWIENILWISSSLTEWPSWYHIERVNRPLPASPWLPFYFIEKLVLIAFRSWHCVSEATLRAQVSYTIYNKRCFNRIARFLQNTASFSQHYLILKEKIHKWNFHRLT